MNDFLMSTNKASVANTVHYRPLVTILLAIFVVVQLVDGFGNLVGTRMVGWIGT